MTRTDYIKNFHKRNNSSKTKSTQFRNSRSEMISAFLNQFGFGKTIPKIFSLVEKNEVVFSLVAIKVKHMFL